VGLWLKPIGLVQRSAATQSCASVLHSCPRALVMMIWSCYGALEIVGGIIVCHNQIIGAW